RIPPSGRPESRRHVVRPLPAPGRVPGRRKRCTAPPLSVIRVGRGQPRRGPRTPPNVLPVGGILSTIPGVTLAQLDALAARAPQPRAASFHPSRRSHPSVSSAPADVIVRARAYLATIPGAVAGSRGHDRTFYAANRLVRG